MVAASDFTTELEEKVAQQLKSQRGGYRTFLLESNNPDDREYTEDADHIREILIHGNYLSQKDIELCAALDIIEFVIFPSIKSLHQTLTKQYINE